MDKGRLRRYSDKIEHIMDEYQRIESEFAFLEAIKEYLLFFCSARVRKGRQIAGVTVISVLLHLK